MGKDEIFKSLTADREHSAETFDKPSMSGFKRLLSDMYADKAHFIYELIQNADDAKATKIKFIIKKDELFFLHNGKEKFSLSDPAAEEIDSRNKKLGHINSITSVGNTTKSEQKIGKFGIGFKSVFQYTDSPIIQDDNFSFQVKKLFVPYLYEKRYNHRLKGETLFVIPFNKNKQEAFDDSKNKFEKFDETILLFLNNIEEMQFQYLGKNKLIKKKVIKESTHTISETGFDKIKSSVVKIQSNKYLLFYGYIQNEELSKDVHKIAVAYPLNKHDDFESDRLYNAYCFFPTQEQTGFKFILHAPFLLTDNRQNIKRDLEWNENLIENLGDLVYDSFLIMKKLKYINNKFFYSLPLDTEKYGTILFHNRDLFEHVYNKIRLVLITNEIIPTNQGVYVFSRDAYLIRGKELSGLLDNHSLRDLKISEKASTVFPEISESGKTTKLWYFLKETLGIKIIEARDFIGDIDESFLLKRSDNWLIMFYKYCLTIEHLWDDLKKLEIIRLEDNTHVSPYINDVPQVFLEEIDPNYRSIKKVFLQDTNSTRLFKRLGISTPSKKNIIFRTIIQRYENNNHPDDNEGHLKDFEDIINYYYECNQEEMEVLINKLKDTYFLLGKNRFEDNSETYLPEDIYWKSKLLDEYFEDDKSYIVFDEVYYEPVIKKTGIEKINNFLVSVGINLLPKIAFELKKPEDIGIFSYNRNKSYSLADPFLEGFDNLKINLTLKKSVLLWSFLKEHSKVNALEENRNSFAEYFYHRKQKTPFVTTLYRQLTETAWLYNKNLKPLLPKQIFVTDLHSNYDLQASESLIKFLELKDISEKYSSLSEEERKGISLVKDLINAGIKPEELFKKLPELKDLILNHLTQPDSSPTGSSISTRKSIGKRITVGKDDVKVIIDPKRSTDSIIKEKGKIEINGISDREIDDDDLTPKTTITADQLENIKKKLENEAELLNRLENLRETAKNSEKYTLAWFNALMELEFFNRKDREFRKSSIHVTFNNIQKDPASDRTLILSGTNYLPEAIEDNESLSLTLSYKSKKQTILIEAVSRRNKILKAKLKDNINIDDLNIDSIERAEIDVKNANFIFENLKQSFTCFSHEPFNFKDEYNFKDNLPEHLEVIFGPPGTGKTTFIAGNTIYPITKSDKFKILVLAPTNKAADVLTNKLIEVCEKYNDKSYLNWLVRFGITNEPSLEGIVFHNNKYITKAQLKDLVLVTTVARFTYDSIMVDNVRENQKYFLKDYDWDYIIFDESSMINLPSTVFPLFYRGIKKPNTRFIFSGDPFQISPIVFVNEASWKDGNIFSLVELNKKGSFINPKPNPADIKITNLTKQFRSIPQIGSLFSKLTYDDKLEHHRKYSSIKEISIQNLDIKPITILNFKVDEFDSIYRSHKLKGSPYHIYSSLFVVEVIDYLIKNIDLKTNKDFSIGIICPYRAQQSIIDKIIGTFKIPSNISLSTGTIHGFQGDECDMIISLFNPPKVVTKSEDIFLNKHNIINVSISRARDYLILLMPYDPSNRISVKDLFLLEEIKKICYTDQQIKLVCKSFKDTEIEKIIFGKPDFIEQISFPTAHQDVNVYSVLDRKYEIRYDESAVDIQIKK